MRTTKLGQSFHVFKLLLLTAFAQNTYKSTVNGEPSQTIVSIFFKKLLVYFLVGISKCRLQNIINIATLAAKTICSFCTGRRSLKVTEKY